MEGVGVLISVGWPSAAGQLGGNGDGETVSVAVLQQQAGVKSGLFHWVWSSWRDN